MNYGTFYGCLLRMSSVLWLALLLAGLQIRPAPRPESISQPGSIQGVVIRAGAAAFAARRELADARVELKPGNLYVMTGADGAFLFRNLQPGKYTISVIHERFVPQEDRQHGFTISGMTVDVAAGQAVKGIELPMTTAPMIAGTVFDPRGEPLATALVRAYRRKYTPIGSQLRILKKAMTNDAGEFRLFGLSFGEYFVSGGYSDRDRATAAGNTLLTANVSKPDDGYATVFYDGSDDLSRARPAVLAPGIEPGLVNIYLAGSARFKIRGQVLPVMTGIKIILAPKGGDLTDADSSTEPDARGAFEIRGVSPGSYLLLARGPDDAFMSDVVAVNVVDSDIDGVRLGLQQTISIAGGLSVEGRVAVKQPEMRIRLVRSTIEFDQKIEAPLAPDGEFILEHVAPNAEYDVVIDPLPPGLYVKRIESGQRPVLQGKSRLIPNERLKIVLDFAPVDLPVHGFRGRDDVPGAQVVLIPAPALRRRADRYFTGFTGKNGNLQFTAVPPGTYTAYAFERLERDAYYVLGYDAAANDRFANRSVFVIVEDDRPPKKPIELSVIPATETAGGLQ